MQGLQVSSTMSSQGKFIFFLIKDVFIKRFFVCFTFYFIYFLYTVET